jgi:hypothetical protein
MNDHPPPAQASTTAFEMKLRKVPARRGGIWVRQGLAVLFARPLAVLGLTMMWLVTVQLLVLLALPELVATGLVLTLVPLVSLGFMLATHKILRGERVTPLVFVEPLQINAQRRNALLTLCVLFAALSMGVSVLSEWIDGGKMRELMQLAATGQLDQEALQAKFADPQLQKGVWFDFAMNTLLVHWGGQSAPKALFFSVVAMWRSKLAFLGYGLMWSALMLLMMGLGAMLLTAIGSSPDRAAVVFLPLMMTFIGAFSASLFFTFADSFELAVVRDVAKPGEAPPSPAAE